MGGSADRWGVCPRCYGEQIREKERMLQQAEEAYGAAPQERFFALHKQAHTPIAIERELREDYEVRTDKEGVFHVSYRCECMVCALTFSFEHQEVVWKGWPP